LVGAVVLDFNAELEKLLSREEQMLPRYEFSELAAAGQQLLAELDRKQSDTSLQIEEIYDLVKEQRGLIDAMESEKAAKSQLVSAAVGITDLIEYFWAYARQSGSEDLKNQAGIMWQNAAALLSSCGIFRFGAAGEPLDPRIHTVKSSAASSVPHEHVAEVLQSGYAYQNSILRKAAVVVSLGQETAGNGTDAPAGYSADNVDQQDDRQPGDGTENGAGYGYP
jgi:molecular chaperone GrpE (heat shock protein)